MHKSLQCSGAETQLSSASPWEAAEERGRGQQDTVQPHSRDLALCPSASSPLGLQEGAPPCQTCPGQTGSQRASWQNPTSSPSPLRYRLQLRSSAGLNQQKPSGDFRSSTASEEAAPQSSPPCCQPFRQAPFPSFSFQCHPVPSRGCGCSQRML